MTSSIPSRSRILIVGAGGHGLVVADIVRAIGAWEIVGFVDRRKAVGSLHAGVPILGSDEVIAEIVARHRIDGSLVAVGDNFSRKACVERIVAACPQLRFPAAPHPRATLAPGVVLGEGTVVMAGGVINPGCVLGRHCIVNTGACFDHESAMGDFSSLAPGVVCGGRVAIGERAAVCLGARLIHGVRVGEDAVVGAGALVLRDVPARVVAYGTPARTIRGREPHDPYL